MYKQFAKLIAVMALSLSLLAGQLGFIQAQALTPTPTTTPTATVPAAVTQTPIAPVTDPNVVTFAMLRRNEIQLTGPFDSSGFTFSMPADWKLKEGTQLEVDLGISYSTLTLNQPNPVISGNGTLTVLLNNLVLGVIPLNQIGETNVSFPIPLDRFVSQNLDQSMVLSFVLNSGAVCYKDQNTTIFIHPSSHFILPHDEVKPDTSLVNFPRPLYQNSIITDSAMLVVADKPTAAEMQAALTVSAGLSNLSGNSLRLDLTTVSKLTADQQKTNHIILVGNAAAFASLQHLDLPMPINNNQFQITGGSPDDGVIEMINSPWSNSRVVLVVSGNTDIGIVKAAQAISTGVIQPNQAPNLAVIDKVQAATSSVPQAVDRTLADMGYDVALVQGRGVNFTQYTFNVPPGFTVASDAYFDLVYGNSALLNFNRSGIVVQLNNRPIGSVRLSDVTAGSSTNKSRILIPAAAVVPGLNVLQVVTDLVPTDDCTPPGVHQGLWVNIWPQSLLHLPLTAVSVTPASTQKNLTSYLPSFIYNPLLSDTAFVLPGNNPDAWRAAVQMAAFLGAQANGPVTELAVFYADNVPVTERSKYSFLVVGRPSEMPFVQEINNDLPTPFLAGSDAPKTSNFRVTYRIPAETPMGYIEIMPSAWNSKNVVMSILGNSTQGLSWAAAALTDSTLNWRLAGNFALVNNRQILTTDTSTLIATSGIVATQAPNETAQPVANVAAPVQPAVSRPNWLLPALSISVVLILLILAIVAIGSWSRNRTRSKRG